MNNKKILLVEDNSEIQRSNKKMLEMYGYTAITAQDIHTAKNVILNDPPDLIVLDIMMPDGSGLDLCREVREQTDIPILFLTALAEKDAVVWGLRAGGDDYLAKPYDYDELLARIEALLRRASRSGNHYAALHIGALEIKFSSRRAFLKERDLLLTSKEFAVLEALARRQGTFISSAKLFETVWGLDANTDARTVKEHIYRLRHKLAGAPVRIESARGGGYRLITDLNSEGGEKLT